MKSVLDWSRYLFWAVGFGAFLSALYLGFTGGEPLLLFLSLLIVARGLISLSEAISSALKAAEQAEKIAELVSKMKGAQNDDKH